MKKILVLLISVIVLNMGASAKEFVPRLTAPDKNSPYYTTLNVFHQFGYGMEENGGNCTCYAYGRAYEILKSKPSLSNSSAGKWYDYNKSGGYYPYGKEARVGAIAVWKSTKGGAGHVAVVEEINGDIATTSESGWNSYYFKTVKRNIKDKNFGASASYEFQGFIYLLGSEKPKTEGEVISKSGVPYVNVGVTGTDEECYIIVSSFKNGAMVETSAWEHDGETKTVSFTKKADSVKIMVWNLKKGIKPVSGAVEIPQKMWKIK